MADHDEFARVLVLTPDSNVAIGGIKMHYQMVDALNRVGVPAAVVHRQPGFRCTWFDNTTPVVDVSSLRVNAHDLLVVPEEWVAFIPGLPAHAPKAVFHQNAYTTWSWGWGWEVMRDVFARDDVTRVVTVSDDNVDYLSYAFPNADVVRVRYTIDHSVFNPTDLRSKRRQLAYMPRRRARDAADVLSLLRARDALDGWDVVAIEGMNEAQVAQTLKESAIFLSFSEREGFGLPPAEAMACGCVVIGFHGFGGREFADHGLFVHEGDVLEFARTVERAIDSWEPDARRFEELSSRAADFVARTYCAANTESDVLQAFGRRIGDVPAGEFDTVPDDMWQVRPLATRVLGRLSRARNALLGR